MMEQLQLAENVMKKKGPKVDKKGKAFDSATFEMQKKIRKESNGSETSDLSHEE